MRYILPNPAETLVKFASIRTTYESRKPVDLKIKPGFFSLPTAFGGIAVEKRKEQISLLENLAFLIKLEAPMDLKRPTEHQIAVMKFFIITCLFVRRQNASYTDSLGGGSQLSEIINEFLEVSGTNFLDKVDLMDCFKSARELLASKVTTKGQSGKSTELSLLDYLNGLLKEAKRPLISASQWKELEQFIEGKSNKLKLASSYPIARYTSQVMGAVFGCAGKTLGLVAGEAISHSSQALAPKRYIAAGIGTTLVYAGCTGAAGVAFIVPALASQIFQNFCRLSMMDIAGTGMELLGQGAGAAAGLPLDLTCKAIDSLCQSVLAYLESRPNAPKITGLRLTDGKMMVGGIPVDILLKGIEIKELTAEQVQQYKTIEDGGVVAIGNKALVVLKPKVAVAKPVVVDAPEADAQEVDELDGFSELFQSSQQRHLIGSPS